jgi:N-acetylmuramoyl-L-alanine amidase
MYTTLITATCLSAAMSVAPLVAVDVGHSLTAPGAISARGRPEFEFNRDLAAELARALTARGLRVRMIGAKGDQVMLSQRTDAARGAHLFLSVHHDSVPQYFFQDWQYEGVVRGFSDLLAGSAVFVSRRNPQFARSLECAAAISGQLRTAGFARSPYHREWPPSLFGLFDRNNGVRYHQNIGVLHRTDTPAVLLEAGVIVNRTEELALRDPATQRRMAAAVAEAVQLCLTGFTGQ